MMKLGAFALNPGSLEYVPGPVQTLKLARTCRSVISIGFERSAPSITTLVVAPFPKSLEGTRHANAIESDSERFPHSCPLHATDVVLLMCINA